MDNMVDVRNLKKYFPVKGGFIQHTLGYVQAVDDISFTIQRGKVLGLVGESGAAGNPRRAVRFSALRRQRRDRFS